MGYEKSSNKKNFPKKILFIIPILIISICCICIVINNNSQEKKYSEMILKDKKYDGLRIENVNFIKKNSTNYLEFQVINLTENDYEQKKTYIIFLGEDAKIISKYPIKIPKILSNSRTKLKVRVQESDLYSYTFLISDI